MKARTSSRPPTAAGSAAARTPPASARSPRTPRTARRRAISAASWTSVAEITRPGGSPAVTLPPAGLDHGGEHARRRRARREGDEHRRQRRPPRHGREAVLRRGSTAAARARCRPAPRGACAGTGGGPLDIAADRLYAQSAGSSASEAIRRTPGGGRATRRGRQHRLAARRPARRRRRPRGRRRRAAPPRAARPRARARA